jgi:hypothetical protein
MNNRIYIDKDTLPNNEQDALELLYNYFNGFDIEYDINEQYYAISLTRSDFAYCEDISKGLKDICINEQNIKDFCYLTDNACLCLSENWIPYAWSVIAPRTLERKNKIAIIHVDDHSDLMAPFVRCEAGCYYNMLNGAEIDFLKKKSMRDVVSSGAITIGSMLTPIVYTLQSTNIYHVKKSVSEKIQGIRKTFFNDSFIKEGHDRINISFEENTINDDRYILTSEWSSVIRHIGTEYECILHIDMDYFNNRYNGSTSWSTDGLTINPSFEEQKKCMDVLCSSVKQINGRIPIKYILVGVSPSFYPAEYWENGLNYLLKGLKNAGLNVQGLIDRINVKGKYYGNSQL